MALLSRVFASKSDPGATVESVTVTPRPAPEKDVAELDKQLVELLHRQPARKKQSSSTPPAADGVVANPGH
jgi:hypothetical protein